MRSLHLVLALLVVFVIGANAASKPDVMSRGKPTPVKLLLGPLEEQLVSITVRPLYLDTKLKE